MTSRSEQPGLALPTREALIAAAITLAIYYATTAVAMSAFRYAGAFIFGTAPSGVPGHPLFETSLAIGAATAAAYAYSRLREFGWRAFRRPTVPDLGVFAVAAVAVFVLYVVDSIVMRAAHVHDVAPVLRHFSVRDVNPAIVVAGIVSTLVASCIAVPMFEEAMERALLFGGLLSRTTPVIAAVLSAIFFGVIHRHPIGFPLLFVYGLIAAASYAVTRNLFVPIALHFTTNAVVFTLVIISNLSH